MSTQASADSLRDVILGLARRFAAAGPPAAGSAAAATGAIAAGLLEWSAGLAARRGSEAFRSRGDTIARRAAALQASLGRGAETDAEAVRCAIDRRDPEAALRDAADSALEIGRNCAQVVVLAAEVARDGYAPVRPDVMAALRLASSAAACALRLAEDDLRSTVDADRLRYTRRHLWRTRLLLQRGLSALGEDATPRLGEPPESRQP